MSVRLNGWIDSQYAMSLSLTTPYCLNMQEHPDAEAERLRLSSATDEIDENATSEPSISNYIRHGLAYTVGSALDSTPPTLAECLAAFVLPNKAGLTAGSRAWSKHAHRSQGDTNIDDSKKSTSIGGWWGRPSGPVAAINSKSLLLFWKVVNDATWRNLHWLPHRILVYEVRVAEGYGMRWSQDQNTTGEHEDNSARPWVFRGFVEPMMKNGHEVGWKH